jgi:hypothetical protein
MVVGVVVMDGVEDGVDDEQDERDGSDFCGNDVLFGAVVIGFVVMWEPWGPRM